LRAWYKPPVGGAPLWGHVPPVAACNSYVMLDNATHTFDPVLNLVCVDLQAAMQSRQQQSDHQDDNHDAQQLDAATQRMARLSILRHQQHAQAQLTSV